MLITLTWTFVQGHTDLNHKNNKCSTISETVQAMPRSSLLTAPFWGAGHIYMYVEREGGGGGGGGSDSDWPMGPFNRVDLLVHYNERGVGKWENRTTRDHSALYNR